MIRASALLLALAATAGLSACGGAGGSEFAVKANAACVKEQGQASAAKCACQVALAEKELTDKEKKFLLVSLDMSESATPEAGMKAMSDAGITMADMMSMAVRMQTLDARVQSECPA